MATRENALIKKLVGCLAIEPQALQDHPSCAELDSYRARVAACAPNAAHLVIRASFPPTRPLSDPQGPPPQGEASTSPPEGLQEGLFSRPPTAGGLDSDSADATQLDTGHVDEEGAGERARAILKESIPRMTGGPPPACSLCSPAGAHHAGLHDLLWPELAP